MLNRKPKVFNRSVVKQMGAVALAAAALAGVKLAVDPLGANARPPKDSGAPATVKLSGVVRDFRAANVKNGHPDFDGPAPSQGLGIYADIAADTLNADGDPVFASAGYKVSAQATDAQGRPILAGKSYIAPMAGDRAAAAAAVPGNAVASAASFADWYRDNALVNMSAVFTIPMTPANGYLTFDGDLRTQTASLSGFGGNKVYGYTFEIEMKINVSGDSQVLTFGADDCMWAYLDGKLVIDLGGMHSYMEQTIDLARLSSWLSPGQHTLKVFYAERDKHTSSRFKMSVTDGLAPIAPPAVNGLYD